MTTSASHWPVPDSLIDRLWEKKQNKKKQKPLGPFFYFVFSVSILFSSRFRFRRNILRRREREGGEEGRDTCILEEPRGKTRSLPEGNTIDLPENFFVFLLYRCLCLPENRKQNAYPVIHGRLCDSYFKFEHRKSEKNRRVFTTEPSASREPGTGAKRAKRRPSIPSSVS